MHCKSGNEQSASVVGNSRGINTRVPGRRANRRHCLKTTTFPVHGMPGEDDATSSCYQQGHVVYCWTSLFVSKCCLDHNARPCPATITPLSPLLPGFLCESHSRNPKQGGVDLSRPAAPPVRQCQGPQLITPPVLLPCSGTDVMQGWPLPLPATHTHHPE